MEVAYLETKDYVLKSLRVEPAEGLSSKEVGRRQQRLGLNVIPGAKKSRVLGLLFDRFRDVLFLILVGAGVVSLLIGHAEDAIIIAVAIAIDAGLSFAQVWRTERTLSRLRESLADTILVTRDGASQTIPTAELVPGDIIEFRAGERVPADARLISVQGLRVQEAILTGEATDVEKDVKRLKKKAPIASRMNMIFAGTEVVSGSGKAVVVATGSRMEFGKIAQMLREQKSPDTPLRRKLQQTGARIGWVIIGAVVLLALIGLLQGESLADTSRTAITLMVSAIPEDLTMILTIALTVGVTRILRAGGVVRKLGAGETLGAATVICTDKTGTLTEGKMTAQEFNFLQGSSIKPGVQIVRESIHELALTTLAVVNNAHPVSGKGGKKEYFGQTTERTSLSFVESIKDYNQADLQKKWRVRDTIPFSPEWKFQVRLVDHPTQSTQLLLVTGAPDVLLARSSMALSPDNEEIDITAERRVELKAEIDRLAGKGYRLLAVAVRRHMNTDSVSQDDVHNLTLLGVLTITDPVRNEVVESIKETLEAGVAIKLITGDHAGTARAVARAVGLPADKHTVCDCQTLDDLDDDNLREIVETASIFSRVEPLAKQRIVRLLQERGHVVAMTGDGVNDAVALKGADIGVAMASGSDVAKDAADLVLLNNSFSTITAAIKEGRVLRDNIRKVIAFLLATNAAEVAIFFVSRLLGLPLPLLPAQVLWINLVTDGTSDIALSLEPAEEDVMKRNPEDPNRSLFDKGLLTHIVFSGIIMTIGTMGLFWYLLRELETPLPYARTMAFVFLAVASLLSVWSFRSLKTVLFTHHIKGNPWVLVSSGFSFGLQLLAIYVPGFRVFFDTVPLAGRDWVIIVSLAIVTVAIIDTRKWLFPWKPIETTRRSGVQTPLPVTK